VFPSIIFTGSLDMVAALAADLEVDLPRNLEG
jgi:hypothetical protein